MFQRILVPLDGSALAEQVLPTAARLARIAGGSVILLRVVKPPVEYASGATYMIYTPMDTIEESFSLFRKIGKSQTCYHL